MITPITFLRETYDELKKVVWPSKDDIIKLTGIVIMISIIIGIYIGSIDYVFTTITQLALK
jgi:preprotein translocase subunit SecE